MSASLNFTRVFHSNFTQLSRKFWNFCSLDTFWFSLEWNSSFRLAHCLLLAGDILAILVGFITSYLENMSFWHFSSFKKTLISPKVCQFQARKFTNSTSLEYFTQTSLNFDKIFDFFTHSTLSLHLKPVKYHDTRHFEIHSKMSETTHSSDSCWLHVSDGLFLLKNLIFVRIFF